jgi:hypothetical protein
MIPESNPCKFAWLSRILGNLLLACSIRRLARIAPGGLPDSQLRSEIVL